MFERQITSLLFSCVFRKPSAPIYQIARPFMLQVGACVQGEGGKQYRLLSRISKDPSNVWKAVEENRESLDCIVKAPSNSDEPSLDWPLFQHELRMQRRFENAPLIRPMIDFIPRSESSPPMLVLQAFERSLWNARNMRILTVGEIKWIMKAVLIALWTIHREGLVYSDLKMENVLLNGLQSDAPGDVRTIIARLADCGAITEPSNREITSITYRSPEVYFGRPWTSSTDIWSWGIMYSHLLEARAELSSPGIYDSIHKGTLEDKTVAVRNAIAQDFSLKEVPFYRDDQRTYSLLSTIPETQGSADWWGERLLRKGVPAEDIAFLADVLDPDPTERLSAEEIIRSGYLNN